MLLDACQFLLHGTPPKEDFHENSERMKEAQMRWHGNGKDWGRHGVRSHAEILKINGYGISYARLHRNERGPVVQRPIKLILG